MSPPTNNWG